MNVGSEAAAPSGEESLLARAKSDPDAFAAFYDRYSEAVLRYLAGRLLDVEIALDLMSETFAKALKQRLQFRGATQSEERAWLFAIAGSELSNYWRRGKVERRTLRAIGVSVPVLSDPDLEQIEARLGVLAIASELRHEMNQLPHAQRLAVTMRVIDELGYDEIARRIDVSPEVVRARVSRGLNALSSALRARGIESEDVA